MHILVLNSGSSTLKYALFDKAKGYEQIIFHKLEWAHFQNKREALLSVKALLQKYPIRLIGHRVVHGGMQFTQPTLIDNKTKETIRSLIPLAPLHNPANLEGIELAEEFFPGIPQYAVFDTAFHRTMPEESYTYPIPLYYREEGIIRYGFHGISHQYCAGRAAKLLKKQPQSLQIITCHIGNGASLAAIKNGECIDTTMGFTPLEGLMMGTRSGSIDPGIIFYLGREKKMSLQELDDCLNFYSGLQGIAGIFDMRTVEERVRRGEREAYLAFRMYIHRFKAYLGSLLAALDRVDAIVFTGGIGENSFFFREAACSGLRHLGIWLNEDLNRNLTPDDDIARLESPVRILLIKTREEWEIARQIGDKEVR